MEHSFEEHVEGLHDLFTLLFLCQILWINLDYLLLDDLHHWWPSLPGYLTDYLYLNLSEVVIKYPRHLRVKLQEAIQDSPIVKCFQANIW